MSVKVLLENRKSYILATLGVIYAITGVLTGHLGTEEALAVVWASLSIASLKGAISKVK